MKNIASMLIVIFVGSNIAVAQVEIEKRRPAPPNGEVYIENSFGSIAVRGWDKNEVLVRGVLAPGAEELSFDSDEDGVYLSVEVPDAWYYSSDDDSDYRSTLEIFVPSQSAVGAESVNATVEITGIGGEIEVESVNGGVRIEGANAGVEVESMTGSIDITASGAPMGAESISGPVTLRGAEGEVSVSTVSAHIEVVGERIESLEIESTSGTVNFSGSLAAEGDLEIETFSGDVTLTLEPSAGAQFDLTTFSGTIQNDFGPSSQSSDRFTPHKKLRFRTGPQDFDITVDTHNADITITTLNRN